MHPFFRLVIAFLAVTGAVALFMRYGSFDFGTDDYWDHHGVLFLIAATVFPRLTLLFGGVVWGGWIGWLSWLFVPRIMIAVMATFAYWHSNPFLVLIAWLIAVGGESGEKSAFKLRQRKPRRS